MKMGMFAAAVGLAGVLVGMTMRPNLPAELALAVSGAIGWALALWKVLELSESHDDCDRLMDQLRAVMTEKIELEAKLRKATTPRGRLIAMKGLGKATL